MIPMMLWNVLQTGAGKGDVAADEDEINTGAIWETVEGLAEGFLAVLPKLGIAVVLFAIVWLVARTLRGFIQRAFEKRDRKNVGIVIGRVAFFGMVLFGFMLGVTVVAPSMTPGKLLSVLGIGGVAIGFAFKDIFQNLLAGVLILLREPFSVGDVIVSNDYTGVVEEIETRATIIKTFDGQRVIIPNSAIYTDPVTVKNAYGQRRTQYDVGIGYADDIAQAKRVILDAVRGVDGVLSDPEPDVRTWELAGSSVNLRVRWWCEARSTVGTRDEVIEAIKYALDEAGIDMPYPTNVLLFHDQTEETDGDRTRQREGWPAGENPPQPRPMMQGVSGSSRGASEHNGTQSREVGADSRAR